MDNTCNYLVVKEEYINYCSNRKNLDPKTIKSYQIDLKQFNSFVERNQFEWIEKSSIEHYIDHMHNQYKPKSVKRKIASIKAFFHYLEIEDYIEINPFHKIQIKYKEPFILPKTIQINNIESIFSYAYEQKKRATTSHGKMVALRNILI